MTSNRARVVGWVGAAIGLICALIWRFQLPNLGDFGQAALLISNVLASIVALYVGATQRMTALTIVGTLAFLMPLLALLA
ncbi:hypothetical protein KRX51_08060 [Corynebacterium sp. TAE3-ERU12]|uniref:hypothetical protein n=1 Tax=Corynebacterium sp. TAE3-ERU12 TaxID=2849491 RepID=UPI001C44BEF1|nr:hypothetical protein [Corynebacterium sp. TAE3-ERU12]MBV7295861.1 hypothetical protein [Corynebacterium sp. TAE3-ERU12]